MTEVIPLVYFSHADLKKNESLTGKIEYTSGKTDDGGGGGSLGKNLFCEPSHHSKTHKKLKLSLSDEFMNYEAIEENESPFLVGLLDKQSSKIQLCTTPYFVVKPECYLSGNADKENEQIQMGKTYIEKLNSLTAAFGSSKKRKAMHTNLKNKIDSDTLEKAVTAAVEESKLIQAEQNTADKADEVVTEEFSVLPVPNRQAKSPQEVYDLNEVLSISKTEFERFTSEQSIKFAQAPANLIKEWKTNNIYAEYVCDHLTTLANSKSSHQYKIQKYKLLAYLNYLLCLYRLKAAQLKTKSPLSSSEVPDVVINKMFDVYTVLSTTGHSQAKGVRSMPRRLKDKLACHILILALYVDDFDTSVESFQKELKFSQQRILDFYRALGCNVKNQIVTVNNKKHVIKKAELSLPIADSTLLEPKKKARKTA